MPESSISHPEPDAAADASAGRPAPTLEALRRLMEPVEPVRLSPAARLVYVALAWHLGPDGTCRPGTSRLRRMTGLSRSTVFEALRELESGGWVRRERRWRQGREGRALDSTRYVLETSPPTGLVRPADQGSPPAGLPLVRTTDYPSPPGGPEPIYGPRIGTAQGTDGSIAPSAPQAPTAPTRPPKSKRARKPEDPPDPRVQPVLQTFHDEFVKATGHEPPRTHLDYGRDGKRIRELPASYSTEILVQAVKRFFKSPGYIRRSMRFADYIAALPQLVSADGGRPTAGRRVHLGPDHRDPARYDSWER